MKRMQLFEFEDQSWFPNWLRVRVTRFIVAMHRLLGSAHQLAELLDRALKHTETAHIRDLCSGSGGPMLDALTILRRDHGRRGVKLTFSDLYPNLDAAREINAGADPDVRYETAPVDAANPGDPGGTGAGGVRTMICSMHHMPADVARGILAAAQRSGQPFCMFEISDNSFPAPLWWIALLPNFLMVFFVTPLVRPMTWQQLVFTYICPILPALIAWDGAVSNARTYTLSDLDELLEGLHADDYVWEKGTIGGPAKKLYLLGLPK